MREFESSHSSQPVRSPRLLRLYRENSRRCGAFSVVRAVSGLPIFKICRLFARRSPGAFGDVPKFLERLSGDRFDLRLRGRHVIQTAARERFYTIDRL